MVNILINQTCTISATEFLPDIFLNSIFNMMKLLVLALCISYAAAGVVVGHSACPSTPGLGSLEQLRVTGCSVVPCTLIADELHVLEVDFIAFHQASTLNLKLTTIIFGISIVIVDTPLENSAINPGRSYTMRYELVPNGQLAGNNFSLRGELYIQESGTNKNEVCVNVPCTIRN